MLFKITGQGHWYGEEKISNSVVISVPADGPAPRGAEPPAGTMMTKVWVPYIYVYKAPALEGLNTDISYIIDIP